MNAIILLNAVLPAKVETPIGYLIGSVMALLILGYLMYSLIKPEKF